MTGPEIVELSKAVSGAYTYPELSLLLLGLNRNFVDYVPANVPFLQQVQQLMGEANSHGWMSELVLTIIQDRPNNPFINDFLSRHPYWDQTANPELIMTWLEIVQF